MLRMIGYCALVFAPLIVLFAVVLAIGVALFGVAVVRTDTFALFAMAFVAFAVTTSITVGFVLARGAKSPPSQEPPSA
ncbi:MAG: hypothetical protein R3C30_14775 [Hyphomonadaceae bacterium]